ncbi:MAG: hypothetical protein KDE19_22110 [Caldilineaceae bacterium]|nr:hypothetical protein [Caldilineaceae bacterium]
MKALYGFSPTLAPFADKSVPEQVALLKSWGATAIFGGYTNPDFVDEIHAQGLKIYAEFGCFQGKEWWETIPDSRPTLADGTLLEPIEWYHGVNPSIPTVREELLEQLTPLLRDHALDGVWLDFIRWPCRWESPSPKLLQTSFDAATLARFAADAAIDPALVTQWAAAASTFSDYTNRWVEWRIAQITAWVAAARAVVDSVRPTATLGLFAIPWRQTDFDGAIRTVIGQDFAALATYVDVFSPMTYHRMCGQPVAWIGEVASEIATLTQKPVCPVIQAVDQPTPLPNDDYQAALATAVAAADGAIVFTLAGVVEGERIGTTQQVWQ